MVLKNALLLGQRSRPLAFAGGCVLRASLLKDRLALLVVFCGIAHCAERPLGQAPRVHANTGLRKVARMFFSSMGGCGSISRLKVTPAHRSAA